MGSRITLAAVAAAVVVLALTGCTSASTTSEEAPPAEQTSAAAPETALGLAVAESEFGEIVVDGDGMTVYMFDSDTQGAGSSTCEGQCAANWPAVTAPDGIPAADGITGELGTIAGVDGQSQLTLNGWPLYYFAGDSAPGEVNGQGVNDVWWVLTPAGERFAG